MHTTPRFVILTVPLPVKDHRVYLAARRILIRIMGAKAPDVIALVQQNLAGRDATGLADEYLDAMGWPVERGRAITARKGGRVRTSAPRRRMPRDPGSN